MFKRLFQRPLTSFSLKVWRVSASVVAVSTILLFLLFFMGNGHILAKMTKSAQPSLLTARTNNASIRSSDRVSFQTSARPTIRLQPTSVFVGTSTTIVGDHFSQREAVSISSGRWLAIRTKTDRRGHFVLSFRVPLLAHIGFNLIKAASANKKQSANAVFMVAVPRPSASLNPNHGLPGTRVTIRGKNFTSKGYIIILLLDPRSTISSVGTTLGHLTASANGTINTRFTVPHRLLRKHQYKIQVLDIRSEHSISFNFTIR